MNTAKIIHAKILGKEGRDKGKKYYTLEHIISNFRSLFKGSWTPQ